MRPGSQGKLLGTCLLGGVFLVVFVRHLFLGDLFLFVSFSPCCLCCFVSVLGFYVGSCGISFFFCYYICCMITVGFGLEFLVVLVGLLLFWCLGNLVSLFLWLLYLVLLFLYLLVLNILSCYQVGSLVRLC